MKKISIKNIVLIVTIVLLVGLASVVTYYVFANNNDSSNGSDKEEINDEELVKVPYAKVEISANTMITKDMIGYTNLPKSTVKKSKNLMQKSSNVIGMVASYTIPMNSLFYSSALIDEVKKDGAFEEVPDGYVPFYLKVDSHSTYGNSVYSGNFIDLYLKAIDDEGKIIFGKFITNIKVQVVKDSQGNNLFESSGNNKTPAVIIFYVTQSIFELLSKATYIDSLELIPIPKNNSYAGSLEEVEVSSDYLRAYILSKSSYMPQ